MWLGNILDDRIGVLLLAFAAYVCMVAFDYGSTQINVAPFYLLDVLLVSWGCGRAWGLMFAALCAATEIVLGWVVRYPYTANAYLYANVLTRLAAYAVLVWLISRLRSLYDAGQATVRHDFLTGAQNRLGFHEALVVERARQRRSSRPLSIVSIDCDNFKAVNDRLGHAEGDKVLRVIAGTMRAKVRTTDTVARLGGDEFALILPDTDRTGALQAMTALRTSLTRSMQDRGWEVGFSIGVATFVSLDESLEEMLSLSDALMYEAKHRGKNTLVHRQYPIAHVH